MVVCYFQEKIESTPPLVSQARSNLNKLFMSQQVPTITQSGYTFNFYLYHHVGHVLSSCINFCNLLYEFYIFWLRNNSCLEKNSCLENLSRRFLNQNSFIFPRGILKPFGQSMSNFFFFFWIFQGVRLFAKIEQDD